MQPRLSGIWHLRKKRVLLEYLIQNGIAVVDKENVKPAASVLQHVRNI